MRGGRLALACAASVATILSAPFVSEIRFWIRSTFPGHFVLVVGGLVGAAVAAAIVFAFARIRSHRVARYSAIGAALAIAVAYAWIISTDNAQANAVERVHFIEYGLIALLFYQACRPFGDGSMLILPALAGVIVGTFDEWFQWLIPVRVGEMRDVFLNLVAIGCGLMFSAVLDPPPRRSLALGRGSARRVGIVAAVVVVTFAAFVWTVHAGGEVVDAATGNFKSRYDAATLTALAANRDARWHQSPPVVRAIAVEDQYLSEGILHVQERNNRWAAGDYAASWRENLILERYYRPVLDVTYPQPSGSTHRWAQPQRADAEQRARLAVAASPYVSDADHGFIRVWPAWLVWLPGVGAAVVCVAAGYVFPLTL